MRTRTILAAAALVLGVAGPGWMMPPGQMNLAEPPSEERQPQSSSDDLCFDAMNRTNRTMLGYCAGEYIEIGRDNTWMHSKEKP